MIESLHIGPFAVSSFGVTLLLALVLAYWQMRRALRIWGIGDTDDATTVFLVITFFGLVSGKVYYAILLGDWRLVFDRSGLVFYGCFIGAVLAFFWIVPRRGLPVAGTFDAIALAGAVGYGVGRIGCFLVGDDYGVPTDLPWGVTFRVGLPPTTAGNLREHFGVEIPPEIPDGAWIAVHPTQLYESAAGFLIWFVLLYLMRRNPRPGTLWLLFMALMGVERFFVELVRAKDDRFFGELTLAQLLSVAMVLIAAGIAWWRRGRAAESAGQAGVETSGGPA